MPSIALQESCRDDCRIRSCILLGWRIALGNLLALVNRETAWTHVNKQQQTTDDRKRLEEVVSQKVARRVSRVDRPEVVDEEVEDAENHDQETGAPASLEADNNHDAGTQAEHRDDDTCQGPLALNDETDEKEDEQHSAGQLEVNLAVGLAQAWKAGKDVLLGREAVRENHHETTNDGKVAKEEVEIENETVSETLDHNNTEQCTDRDLGVFAQDHSRRSSAHDL